MSTEYEFWCRLGNSRSYIGPPFRLQTAKHNVYGVFPGDLSPSELRFAELLDTSPEVLWWHRNPVRQPESVALYRSSSGVGFFPDSKSAA